MKRRTAFERVIAQAGSARVQLTLWYLGVVLTTMLIFALVLYVELANHLHTAIDQTLQQVAQTVVELADEEPFLEADVLLPGHVATLFRPDLSHLETLGA